MSRVPVFVFFSPRWDESQQPLRHTGEPRNHNDNNNNNTGGSRPPRHKQKKMERGLCRILSQCTVKVNIVWGLWASCAVMAEGGGSMTDHISDFHLIISTFYIIFMTFTSSFWPSNSNFMTFCMIFMTLKVIILTSYFKMLTFISQSQYFISYLLFLYHIYDF